MQLGGSPNHLAHSMASCSLDLPMGMLNGPRCGRREASIATMEHVRCRYGPFMITQQLYIFSEEYDRISHVDHT